MVDTAILTWNETEQAALAYDLAAVKFRGRGAATNFDTSAFEQELAQLDEACSACQCNSTYLS